ncbi:DUF1697 domain-containing protein [Cyclobacteriaceae bacterium]|nr:DUF1697 domain-containing protein [Cyclobacteriaceae bacterium]
MTKLALLRGINVGGHNKLLKADLISIIEECGGHNVQTYIQSGNILFDHRQECMELESQIKDAIKVNYGIEVPVLVIEGDDFLELVANNPFEEDVKQLHATLLKERPSEALVQNLKAIQYAPDEYSQIGKAVYIFCKGAYHETKLSNNAIEQQLQIPATTRTWKTILKLKELLEVRP